MFASFRKNLTDNMTAASYRPEDSLEERVEGQRTGGKTRIHKYIHIYINKHINQEEGTDFDSDQVLY